MFVLTICFANIRHYSANKMFSLKKNILSYLHDIKIQFVSMGPNTQLLCPGDGVALAEGLEDHLPCEALPGSLLKCVPV